MRYIMEKQQIGEKNIQPQPGEKSRQPQPEEKSRRSGISALVLVILILILVAVILVSMSVGSADISVGDSFRIILSRMPGFRSIIDSAQFSQPHLTVIWQVRLPRIFVAVFVGGILSIVGAAFQSIFRNPLADPHILGVSSGAALGATVAMLIPSVSGLAIPFLGLGSTGIFAFGGALITVFIVYQVAKIGGRYSTVNVLLTGTAISTLFSSIISLLMTFNHDQIGKVYMWTLGSFNSASWARVRFVLIFAAVGVVVLTMCAQKLNVMLVGEEEAETLGINVQRLRRFVIVFASILVAAAVSVSGIIGFVGLMIPHCVRMICGPDLRRIIPYGFILGAAFLVVCDTLARTIAAPTEIPVGIITAICGAPYFIYLVWRQFRRT